MDRLAVGVFVMVALGGCDKLPGLGGGDESAPSKAQAEPTQAPVAAVEPVVAPSETPPAAGASEPPPNVKPAAVQPPTPEPPVQPPSPASEFDGLLVKISTLAEPRRASEPSVEQTNKTAWTHYKAKQWPEAAQYFARTAARDPAWKHAHNLACALAQAGKSDDARIALAESLKRGGDAAVASAKKDADLASIRALPWFAELLDPPPTDEAFGWDEPQQYDEEDQDFATNDTPPPNCPPEVTIDFQHFCWHDVLAEFAFEEVVFTTPISLALEVPSKPKDANWKLVESKIPWKELRAELGIQHTTESASLAPKPNLLEWSWMVWEDKAMFEQDADELAPYFWWPEPNTPILVLPNRQKLGSRRVMGVALARKTDSGWQAINLPVTKESQLTGSTNYEFESGVILRFDGLELFTLTQFVYHDDGDPEIDERSRFLCRIRYEGGKLVRACTERWKETGKSFG